jgi:hypothetical protein
MDDKKFKALLRIISCLFSAMLAHMLDCDAQARTYIEHGQNELESLINDVSPNKGN